MTCIIIDDEKNAREGLQLLIKNFAPEVEVLKLCKSANEGINAITELTPDLIFLDVEMPHMTGFEMLEKIQPKNFDVMTITL
jgi:two-component system LytT family response regulator